MSHVTADYASKDLAPESPRGGTQSSPPARFPLIPLILVVLGVALYFCGWLISYFPGKLPMMPLMMATMWGPMLCSLLLGVWWLIFGRASFQTRLVTFVLVASLAFNAIMAAHEWTRFWLVIWGLPAALAAMTVVLLALFNAPTWLRYSAAILVAVGFVIPWELVRIDGVTGEFAMDPAWRWTPTADQRIADFLASGEGTITPAEGSKLAPLSEGDWPGFRGAARNGIAPAVDGAKLKELWRHPVGPGWGSVSGVGDRIFTQEQRDKEEVVACYDLKTGKQIWAHAEKSRHYDGPSGAGPRATPTFHKGKLYALGGAGVLVCLDAATGERVWKVDITKELDIKEAVFGFACSPLVVKGRVYLHPGVKGPTLAAFDAKTGKKLWTVGELKHESYSSPQWAKLAGVEQVLIFSAEGLTGHDPVSGKELWRHVWESQATAQPCVQPTLLPDDRVVIGGAQPATGIRCVKVKKSDDKWEAALEWETIDVSPRFNDVVYHDGHLYGLDGGRLFCLNAADGGLSWKTRPTFGTGQVMLSGKRLVVLSERGKLTWAEANPESYKSVTTSDAITGKTWNHPAIVRGHVIARNGEEMVCYGPSE